MSTKFKTRVPLLGLALFAGPAFLAAQTQPPQPPPPDTQQTAPHGWRRADDPAMAPQTPMSAQSSTSVDPNTADRAAGTPGDPAYQTSSPRDAYGAPVNGAPVGAPAPAPQQPAMGPQGQQPMGPGYQGPGYQGPGYQAPGYQGPGYQGAAAPQAVPPPATLTLKPGTYITVRVNQPLSSDHNQPGDAFTATLVRPLVVDGFVVAQTGQTIGGRVADAKKAGRVEGVSKLAVQLTDLTLVDGQNIPIQSQLVSRTGPTSVGRDAAAIGGTTALGAAAGAAADWGRGAAIGAGAGALVGVVGVLLTRGHPTIIYPEQVLTFRVEAPVTIATDHAPQAFRPVEPEDYQQGLQASRPMGPRPPGPYGYGYGPSYAYSPYGPYPYAYGPGYYPYPYYWGPSFGFYVGPRFYGRGYYGHFRR